MPVLTLSQIRAGVTRAQATDTVITVLQTLGFPTASWQPGSIPRMMTEIVGHMVERAADYAKTLVDMGFNGTAAGEAMTEFAASHYDNARADSVAAQYTIQLVGAAVGPPHTIAIGDLVVTDGERTYRNTTSGTINASSTLTVTVEAEVGGVDGSSIVPTDIDELATPLAGVTINTAATVLVRAGQDQESDATLRARNASKWGTLAVETVGLGVLQRISAAEPNITRIKVVDNNPRGEGTADIFCATATGSPTTGQLDTAVTALRSTVFMGTVSRTVSTANVYVQAANPQTITITAAVYYKGVTAAQVQAGVEAAIAAYINAAPIGGYDLSPGPSGVILRNDLVAAIEAVDGVRSVVLTAPAADVALSSDEIATVSSYAGITYTAITAA